MSSDKMAFRTLRDRGDWVRLTTTVVNEGWFLDIDEKVPAPVEWIAEHFDEADMYTEWGWNMEPQEYPVLVHMQA